MIVSFKFSIFEVEISHKILQELGEFTIFCMKAINNNLTIENISRIIQINENIIKKQLHFTISRGYLTDDFILTNKGIETVKLFEFVNTFNQNKIKIALEHYIENNSKKIYSINHDKLDDIPKGYIVKDNFYDYKISNKFDEILENDKNSIKNIIFKDFESYKDILEKYLDNCIFKILKLEEQKFYNYEIDDEKFIDILKSKKNKEAEYVSIAIPIVEINKLVTSDIIPNEHIEMLRDLFDKYKYLDLITGKPISFDTNHYSKQKNVSSNIVMESVLSEIDILKKNLSNQQIWFNIFLFTNITTEIKKYNIVKYLDISNILDDV